MVKLLIVGDIHYRGNNPRSRTDDYPAAMRRKLVDVCELGKKHKVDAIIQAGDLFDSPTVSLPSVAEMMTLIWNHSPVSFLTVPGNHDLFGANQTSIARTPYGFMANLRYIYNLQAMPQFFGPDDKVFVTGHGYDVDTDRNIEQYLVPQDVLEETKDSLNVRVVHGMILDQRPGFEMRHTLISEIAMQEKAPDILITGHHHIGFGVKEVEAANRRGKMIVINPGALCRLSAHPEEMERPVQVCLLTITDDLSVEYEMIPLQSARPGYEVLSREHLEVQSERESRIAEFLGLLAEEGEAKFLETREIIEDIGGREKLPKAVVDEALRRLGVAREKVG